MDLEFTVILLENFNHLAPGQYNPKKKGLWINSLQHAREWVTGNL